MIRIWLLGVALIVAATGHTQITSEGDGLGTPDLGDITTAGIVAAQANGEVNVALGAELVLAAVPPLVSTTVGPGTAKVATYVAQTAGPFGSSFGWTHIHGDSTAGAPFSGTLGPQAPIGFISYTGDILHLATRVYNNADVYQYTVAQDIILDAPNPVIRDVSATVDYGPWNGDEISLLVDGASNMAGTWHVQATYTSSYVQHTFPESEFYAWKTAANGLHATNTPTQVGAIDDFPLVIGPRAYHSDFLYAEVWCETHPADRSPTVIVYNEALDFPFTDPGPKPDHDGYGVAQVYIGSQTPDQFTGTTIADYSRSELIWCTMTFFHEGPFTGQDQGGDWDHWVRRTREEPGSRNEAFIGFTNWVYHPSSVYPIKKRFYDYLQARDQTDGATWQRGLEGTPLLVTGEASTAKMPNITDYALVQEIHDIYADDWNHCENREPRVGYMFDVVECFTSFAVYGWEDRNGNGVQDPEEEEGHNKLWGYVVDLNQNGLVFFHDQAEMGMYIEALRNWYVGFRSTIAATDPLEPEVGEFFILGGNSQQIPYYDPIWQLWDTDYIEGMQSFYTVGTELETWTGDPWFENQLNVPYHKGTQEGFQQNWVPSLYWYNSYMAAGLYPSPPNVAANIANSISRMRQTIGPYFMLEAQGRDRADDPVANEIYSLLFDHCFPVYVDHTKLFGEDSDWYRIPRMPTDRGQALLHNIGSATGPMVRTNNFDNTVTLTRQFTNGFVTMDLVAEQDWPNDETMIFSSYEVDVGGVVERTSDCSQYTPVTITNLSLDLGTAGDDQQEATLNLSGSGVIRYRTAEGEPGDPCSGGATWSEWEPWFRVGTSYTIDLNLPEVGNEGTFLAIEVQAQPRECDNFNWTDMACDSALIP